MVVRSSLENVDDDTRQHRVHSFSPTTMATSSSKLALVATGIAMGSAVTIIVQRVLHKLENPSRPLVPAASKDRAKKKLPPDIRDEQLSRHRLYFGDHGLAQLQAAKICVVGVGGVGSHTSTMLARGGIGHLRLIDFDMVTLSSLNRHASATLANVGRPKVECLQQHLQQICPDETYLQVEAVAEMYNAETRERLLSGVDWNIVIDAIDDVPTKADLIATCLDRNIRILSCMGAGGKSDVTRLHISDLRTASRDPLASKLRQHLKKRLPDDSYLDDMERLAIVYSSEKPVTKLAGWTDEQLAAGVDQFGAVAGMRIRVMPVLGTMPAVMGQALAAMALTELGGKPFQPVTGERIGKNVRNKYFQQLVHREGLFTKAILAEAGLEKLHNSNGCVVNGTWIGPVQIDADDVEYLLEIWRNRCGVTGARLGTTLHLVRWDRTKPSTCDNLVLVSTHALKNIEKHGQGKIPAPVIALIEQRLATCRTDR